MLCARVDFAQANVLDDGLAGGRQQPRLARRRLLEPQLAVVKPLAVGQAQPGARLRGTRGGDGLRCDAHAAVLPTRKLPRRAQRRDAG